MALADQFGVYDRMVPREPAANLHFRRQLRLECAADEQKQQWVWDACCRDPLFWINAFVWTYNPRSSPSVIPLVTWEFQDRALKTIFDVFGRQDAGIQKSRDMGASWLGLVPIDYHFIFGDQADFLLLSYKADLVDKSGSMKALMPKLDFIHRHLPEWMQPRTRRVYLEMQNLATNSVVSGEATTGNAGRGGRFKVVFLDEFAAVEASDQANILAATADTTECRLFNSTPNGAGNAYYDLIHRDTTRKISMHWSEHPTKRAGLYRGTSKADFTLLDDSLSEYQDLSDPENPVMKAFPGEYQFILDGKLRSPWYDAECVRRSHNEQEIAKELDIDYHSSDYTYFPGDLLARCLRDDARDPVEIGSLEFSADTGDPVRWTADGGFGNLWCALTPEGKPPPGRYGCAADIAMGTGSTPSTIAVGNLDTGEKVAEFAFAGMSPDRWAKLFVAVCRWFANEDGHAAKAIWEANGPGRAFGRVVMESGLPWVYWRRPEMAEGGKPSDYPGWWNNQDSATMLFNEYRAALFDGKYQNRSAASLEDARQYVVVVGGGSAPVHTRSQRKTDPTGARENHGDMVVADALLVKLMGDLPRRTKHTALNPPPNSIAGRRLLAKSQERKLMVDDPSWSVGGRR